jgi:hypothetical protein
MPATCPEPAPKNHPKSRGILSCNINALAPTKPPEKHPKKHQLYQQLQQGTRLRPSDTVKILFVPDQ